MMPTDFPPEASQIAMGSAGSAAALRWFPGTWRERTYTWVVGSFIAFLLRLLAEVYFGIKAPTGLLLVSGIGGLLGVLIIDKVREFITAASVGDLWKAVVDFVRKQLGVQ